MGKVVSVKDRLLLQHKNNIRRVFLIEFIQDKCNLLDNFQLGQSVKIGINLRGREWVNPEGETKYFNSIQGWRIDEIQSEDSSQEDSFPPLDIENENENDPEDDLPF